MPSPGPVSPPRSVKHLSHSARDQLERCAKSFFLARIARAPKRPAVWLAGGSAVHEATEFYDLRSLLKSGLRLPEWSVHEVWQACFNKQLEEARAKEPNEHKWASSSAEPIAVWNQIGPQFVQSYIDWRERSPWEIWTTPDGEPAIELDVSGFLPGCPVEIKAYVDRIFWDPVMKRHPIVDLKTGKRPPSNADQFGTYSALTKVKFDLTADLGVPFMNRKGTVGKPFELAEYTPEYVGAVYGEAWEQVQRGDWTANGFPGGCFICDVQSSCALQNGPLAHLYDPDSPGYQQAA